MNIDDQIASLDAQIAVLRRMIKMRKDGATDEEVAAEEGWYDEGQEYEKIEVFKEHGGNIDEPQAAKNEVGVGKEMEASDRFYLDELLMPIDEGDEERTEDYPKLLENGLDKKVACKLDDVYKTGKLVHIELDGCALDMLKEFSVDDALVILNQFLESNLEHVSDKSVYLRGIIKTHWFGWLDEIILAEEVANVEEVENTEDAPKERKLTHKEKEKQKKQQEYEKQVEMVTRKGSVGHSGNFTMSQEQRTPGSKVQIEHAVGVKMENFAISPKVEDEDGVSSKKRKGKGRKGKGCCYTKPLLVPGGRAFVWPAIQQVQRISLNTMTLQVESPCVYTSQGVPISVTGIAQVKIQGQNEDMLLTACEQFLGKTESEIQHIALVTYNGL